MDRDKSPAAGAEKSAQGFQFWRVPVREAANGERAMAGPVDVLARRKTGERPEVAAVDEDASSTMPTARPAPPHAHQLHRGCDGRQLPDARGRI